MTEQFEKIKLSAEFIKSRFPNNYKPGICLISDNYPDIANVFKKTGEIKYSEIPEFKTNDSKNNSGKIIFAKNKNRDILLFLGRPHYYDGTDMRSIGHRIYTMKFLGIKKIVSITETAHLNPRFSCGELALIFDHINLMGDNPLIGKNDDNLGLRFPDMSNAYSKDLYETIYKVFQDKKVRINESVLIGITGPESETEAEARFYRDTGADLLGYSAVPENITAVHCGIDFAAIGLITRELIADKMLVDNTQQKQKKKEQTKHFSTAVKMLSKIISEITEKI